MFEWSVERRAAHADFDLTVGGASMQDAEREE